MMSVLPIYLLFLSLAHATIISIQRNYTVPVGKDVVLECTTNNHESVDWRHKGVLNSTGSGKIVVSAGNVDESLSQRYVLLTEGSKDSSSYHLLIHNAQLIDSGQFECVDHGSDDRLKVYLTVSKDIQPTSPSTIPGGAGGYATSVNEQSTNSIVIGLIVVVVVLVLFYIILIGVLLMRRRLKKRTIVLAGQRLEQGQGRQKPEQSVLLSSLESKSADGGDQLNANSSHSGGQVDVKCTFDGHELMVTRHLDHPADEIRGMAVIDGFLYVIHDDCHVILVFQYGGGSVDYHHCIEISHEKDKLHSPVDMLYWPAINCLCISDWKNDVKGSVWKFNVSTKECVKTLYGFDSKLDVPMTLSMTGDEKLVIACYRSIRIYSSDFKLLSTMEGISSFPLYHAISSPENGWYITYGIDEYVVGGFGTYSRLDDAPQRLAKLAAEGFPEREFGSVKGGGELKLDLPKHMVIIGDSLYVADRNNKRVLKFSLNLQQSPEEILNKTVIYKPTRLYYDQHSASLFVGMAYGRLRIVRIVAQAE